jgi:hypothetical protein
MIDVWEKTNVLITVMTYPHPSRGHQELVCTAGITEAGEWVRLYPVDYRYRPSHQQFKKYQWIEVELARGGKQNDKRKESRKPKLDSIKILGEPISPKNNWQERRAIIDSLPIHTRKELEVLYDSEKISLGIVKPSQMIDLKIETVDPDWKPEWQAVLNQFHLFGGHPKELKKIPYKFSYVFKCEDSENPHSAMIEDWELGVLFLKEVERLGSEEAAAQSVKKKYLDEMFAPTKDTRLFMGTTWPYNSWVVIGVFWPPKIEEKQPSLF